jgi:hypothetical protein
MRVILSLKCSRCQVLNNSTLVHRKRDLDDRTVRSIFETLDTWLRTRDILIAGKILAELDYAEKPPKPYTKQELKDMFVAMDDEEKLLYALFLNSGVRGRRNAEQGIRRLQLGEMYAARSAKAVAEVPAQGQEQEEIR